MSVDWNDAAIQRLRDLWASGMKTPEIARRLGTSKNAVIGKAHKIALAPRQSPIKGRDPVALLADQTRAAELWREGKSAAQIGTKVDRAPSTIAHWAAADRAMFPHRPEVPVAVPAPRVTLPDLSGPPTQLITRHMPRVASAPPSAVKPPALPRLSSSCQWPLNGGRPWRFCDAPIARGHQYCAEHAARAFVAVRAA